MTTVVNNPVPAQGTGISGIVIGAIAVIGVAMILLYIGIPVLRSMGPVQVNVPSIPIVMPSKIDVNVTQTK